MPSYMLRQIPDALWTRVRAEAKTNGTSLRDAVIGLLVEALNVRAGRRAGQRALIARTAQMTPAERTARARAAGYARAEQAGWRTTTGEDDPS